MKMRFEKLPLSEVDSESDFFRIGYGPPSEKLEDSIMKIGIVNPVWVRSIRKSGARFQPALGYSRIQVANLHNITPLPCLVIDEEIPDQDIFLANIYDNLAIRELNLVEKATALKKSLSILGRNRTIDEIMPLLRVAPTEETLEKTIRILELDGVMLAAIVQGAIPPSNAFALFNFGKHEQKTVFDIIRTLKLGVNLQKEFMENLFECSRRVGISVDQLMERENLGAIPENRERTEQERANMMRKKLRQLRYPRLSEMERSFQECLRSVELAPEVKIMAPPFFETQDFHLNVKFREPGDLLERLDKIEAAFQSPQVQNWFKHHALQGKTKYD
ncbi:ParB/RepB/Spo0J family partition protein [Candidatus Sumerlaeota bacterium]|nr:ParB/RepB/Spo0J family partition protein [Candidatus Sumerlaeota bacterium]